MDVDVCIVGCGPAGSSVAKVVAANGLDCVVLEEHPEIGLPVECGGGISHSLLDLLGIDKSYPFIKQEIVGSKINFYDEIYNIPSWTGFVQDRHGFDKYLSQEAEKAGAKIFTSAEVIDVKSVSNGYIVNVNSKKIDSINTKFLVGADGLFSLVGEATRIRKPLKPKDFVYCLQHDVTGKLIQEDQWYFIFNEELIDGYAWLFPKGKKTNVGVSTSTPANIKHCLRFMIKEYPEIEPVFESYLGSDVMGKVYGYPISGPRSVDEIVGERLILVGDAAGITNPITGEGVEPSINSGIAAGETILDAFEKNTFSKNFLSRYDKKWRKKKMHNLELGEYLDSSTQLRDRFYKAFNNRRIPRSEREELIKLMEV